MKYLIVDLDDTLLLTSRCNTELYLRAICATIGLQLDTLCSGGRRINRAMIQQIFGDTDVAREIVACKEAYIRNRTQEVDVALRLVEENLVVIAMIEHYQSLGYKPILLTNAQEERTQWLYEELSLNRWFEGYYSKPQSEVNKYTYITKVLDILVEDCFVLENEWQQILLAQEAGFVIENIIKI